MLLDADFISEQDHVNAILKKIKTFWLILIKEDQGHMPTPRELFSCSHKFSLRKFFYQTLIRKISKTRENV